MGSARHVLQLLALILTGSKLRENATWKESRKEVLPVLNTTTSLRNETATTPRESADLTTEDGRRCPSFQVDRNKRLELIHVPKTGGSTLEDVAAAHNTRWAACHYWPCDIHMGSPHQNVSTTYHKLSGAPLWHVPLRYTDNLPWWAQNASFFMVVRHPYTRMLSEWNYLNPGGPKKVNNAQYMNMSLKRLMKMVHENRPVNGSSQPLDWKRYFTRQAHYIPQADYWVPHVHVLRQENLAHEFACLMKAYNLNWTLPQSHSNPARGHQTLANLTAATKAWIATAHAEDFKRFGYSADV